MFRFETFVLPIHPIIRGGKLAFIAFIAFISPFEHKIETIRNTRAANRAIGGQKHPTLNPAYNL